MSSRKGAIVIDDRPLSVHELFMVCLRIFSEGRELFKRTLPGQAMNLLRWAALPAAIATTLLTALNTTALPLEPDYPCYMQTASGRIINLTNAMCAAGGSGGVALPANALAAGEAKQAGRVTVSNLRIIRDRELEWNYVGGTIQNNTGGRIRSVLVSYQIVRLLTNNSGAAYGVKVVDSGSAATDAAAMEIGESDEFKRKVSATGTPRVTKIEWINQDGTYGSTSMR